MELLFQADLTQLNFINFDRKTYEILKRVPSPSLRPAKEASLDKEGAVLILAVYDYDKLSANDYAGLCVVSCQEIPRLTSTKSSLLEDTGPEIKNFMLPLIHIQGSLPLRELEARQATSDPDACSFSKCYKEFLADVPRKR